MTFRALIPSGQLFLVLAVAGLGWGCPFFFDLDSVAFDETLVTADEGLGDMADIGIDDVSAPNQDGGEPSDLGTDEGAEDLGADTSTGPDMTGSRGQTCTDTPGDIGGDCDLVSQNCGNDQFCELKVSGGSPPTFLAVCDNRGSDTFDIPVGEACDVGSASEFCVPGAICRSGVCRAYCRLADASGCQPNQYCTPISSEIGEFGVCEASCN